MPRKRLNNPVEQALEVLDSAKYPALAAKRRKRLGVSLPGPKPHGPENLVYLIRELPAGLTKIGVSSHPADRRKALQTSASRRVTLIACMPGGFVLERELHEKFRSKWRTGEWFDLSAEDILEIVRFGALRALESK